MNGDLRKGVFLMLGSSLCVCVGQLLWKLSVNNGIIYTLLGFCLYGIGALLMIVAYRYGKVSVLQPVLSVNYVLSLILAVIVLGEKLTICKAIGALIITFGVYLVAGSDKKEAKPEETP